MARLALLALAVAAAVACVRPDTHRCGVDDCGTGRCEPIGFCSVPNPDCMSGYSYDQGAGGLSDECVPVAGGADADVDVAELDAAVIDAPIDAPIDARIDAPVDAIDAPPGPIVAHVANADSMLGTAVWNLTTAATIDTGTLSISTTGGLPVGLLLDPADHVPAGGPELAVLHVDTLAISSAVVLRVIGTRPLVIVARVVVIDGRIDASANAASPGAGGALARAGMGPGGDGAHANTTDDGGGGGGAYGGDGASGGTHSPAQGGVAGTAYGDPAIPILIGGSGGGGLAIPFGTPGCTTARNAGAGGGAIQVYALTTITIGPLGGIDAGGGGGGGGRVCLSNNEPGRGGGAGGAIYLQAGAIAINGVLAANGGAGGGSSSGTANTGNAGTIGGDATMALTGVAAGGTTNAIRTGGNGGIGGTGPTAGTISGSSDGGGGGGGVGRIVLRTANPSGQTNTSPTANVVAP